VILLSNLELTVRITMFTSCAISSGSPTYIDMTWYDMLRQKKKKNNNNNNPVSCFKGIKIRVGRSEIFFYFINFLNFIFIRIKNKVSFKYLVCSFINSVSLLIMN
jgi:hypothetical protein